MTDGSQSNQDLLLECIKVHQLSERCRADFIHRIEEYFKDTPLYTYKERIKGASNIQKKVLRKRAERRPDYGPSNITDGWGCRFVTLFQSDMIDIASHVLNFANVWSARLKHFQLIDAVIYDNRPDDDPLSVAPAIKELFDSSNLLKNAARARVKKTSRNTGYSSVHIVIETNISEAKNVYDIEKTNTGEVADLAKFEIQIRDIFEDAWSEIAHIFYNALKEKTLRPDNDTSAVGESLSRSRSGFSVDPHLNALKAVVDGCCQHANLIRDHIPGLNKSLSEGRNLSTTHLDQDRDGMLDGTVIEPERKDLRKTIVEAYELLKVAHTTTELSDLNDAQPFYIDAASKFDEAFRLANGRLPVPTKRQKHRTVWEGGQEKAYPEKTVEYYLRLERANALMFSLPTSATEFSQGESERFARAIEDFEWVLKNYPESASVHLRIGQAYVRNHFSLENLKKAITFLERAADLSPKDPDIGPNHWIDLEIPLQHAHAYYYSAKLDTASTKNYMTTALRIIREAVDHLDLAVEDDDYKLSVINKLYSNLTFYNYVLAEGLSSSGESEFNISKNYSPEVIEKIRGYLNILRGRQLSRYTDNSVETIDSVMIGALIIGNSELAIEMAEKNFRYLKSFARNNIDNKKDGTGEVALILNERQKRMLRRAHSVTQSGADRFVNDILRGEGLDAKGSSRRLWLQRWR